MFARRLAVAVGWSRSLTRSLTANGGCVAHEAVGAAGIVGDALLPLAAIGIGWVFVDVALAERRGGAIARRL